MSVSVHRFGSVALGVFLATSIAMAFPTRAFSQIIILRPYGGGGVPDPTLPTVIASGCFGCPVVVDFSACGSDIRLATVQSPGVVVACAAQTVTTMTNAVGTVSLTIVGASNTSSPSAPGSPEGCASVTIGGVFFGFWSVATADLNGARGGLGDLGMDATDTIQFAGNRTPDAVTVPCTSTNPTYRSRANYISITPCAFQVIDGLDTLAFARFRFGVGRNAAAGGTGSNGPFCP